MNKTKKTLSLLITVITCLLIVTTVQAGQGFEYGRAGSAPYPVVGNVNWVAWLNKNAVSGPPDHILTEDNTNSLPNGGYMLLLGQPGWLLEVENFDNFAHLDTVTILLGGLNSDSGKLWKDSFTFDYYLNGSTYHNESPATSGTTPCPTLTSTEVSGVSPNRTQTIRWTGPAGRYYVYRSTQESGEGTGLSNGRYYLQPGYVTITPPATTASYSQVYNDQAWYIVIPGNGPSGALDGCHSEEGYPTSVVMGDFKVNPDLKSKDIELTWSTFSELQLVGFNLYRSTQPLGERALINPAMIPAHRSGELAGSDYSFIDNRVNTGQTYYYWLEWVNKNGQTDSQGGTKIFYGYTLYIPEITR